MIYIALLNSSCIHSLQVIKVSYDVFDLMNDPNSALLSFSKIRQDFILKPELLPISGPSTERVFVSAIGGLLTKLPSFLSRVTNENQEASN